MVDESRILRQRVESLRDRADRLSAGLPGPDVMVGQVYNGGAGIPTTVPNQFAVHPVTVTGQECEGCTPTVTADASSKTIFTVLGGGKVPVAGDNLVARVVGGRWVADRIKVATQTFNCQIKFTVTTCTGDASGFTVRAQKGTVYDQTRTTDASGDAFFPITTTGLTATVNVASCFGGNTVAATSDQGAPTGYNCCYSGTVRDMSQGGIFVHDVCYQVALPNTLTLSDGFGSVSIGMSAITGNSCTWEGCAIRTASEALTQCSPYDTANIVSGASVPVLFQVSGGMSNGQGSFSVALTAPGCSYTSFPGMPRNFALSGYTCATMNQVTSVARGGPTGPVSSCSPFSWSATMPIPNWQLNETDSLTFAPFYAIYGSSITVTVTA